MHGTLNKPPRKPASAITNGSRLFAERLDLRTPRGKRFKDLLDGYSRDAGGDKLTEAQRAIVRDLAMMQILSEDMQQGYMQSGEIDHVQYSRVVNTMRRHMLALGLIKRDGTKPQADDDDGLSPLEYMKTRGKSRRERLNDDEED